MSWFGGKKKQIKKQYSGFPDDLSPEQQQALVAFRTHMKNKTKIPTQQFDDIYLLRFLRARKFDIPKTQKMWDQFIEWRIKNNINQWRLFRFPQLPTLRKMYPHGYHKVDKQFRPIYIERVGFMDVDKIFKVMTTQNMLQYYSVLYETLLTTIFDGCTKTRQTATGQHNRVSQTMTILDLKHVKLGNASKAYDFVKPVSAMAQNNYPQILGNMLIVNAPMLFTGIWAMVKMWIDDKTKSKIQILGSSYKKEILNFVEPENLPAFLDGGKCKCGGQECNLQKNVGPWNPQGKQMFANNITGKVQEQKQQKIQTKVLEEVKSQKVEQVKQVQTKPEEPKGSQQKVAQQQTIKQKIAESVHHEIKEAEVQQVVGKQAQVKKPEQSQSAPTQVQPITVQQVAYSLGQMLNIQHKADEHTQTQAVPQVQSQSKQQSEAQKPTQQPLSQPHSQQTHHKEADSI